MFSKVINYFYPKAEEPFKWSNEEPPQVDNTLPMCSVPCSGIYINLDDNDDYVRIPYGL